MTVAALFVETDGCYFGLPDVDPWDKSRDARLYAGPHPVVAHPPCQRWGALGVVNFTRWGGLHNMPGNDGVTYAVIRTREFEHNGAKRVTLFLRRSSGTRTYTATRYENGSVSSVVPCL